MDLSDINNKYRNLELSEIIELYNNNNNNNIKLSGSLKTYKEKLNDNIKWEKKNIEMSHNIYEIYYTEYNTKKLIKPFKPYNNYEFEYIFEFGPNCRNYDKNKILDITNCII